MLSSRSEGEGYSGNTSESFPSESECKRRRLYRKQGGFLICGGEVGQMQNMKTNCVVEVKRPALRKRTLSPLTHPLHCAFLVLSRRPGDGHGVGCRRWDVTPGATAPNTRHDCVRHEEPPGSARVCVRPAILAAASPPPTAYFEPQTRRWRRGGRRSAWMLLFAQTTEIVYCCWREPWIRRGACGARLHLSR